MEEQKLFQIGEVARLFHLSVSSLRHYEAAGLLTPEYVDPSSNYRYYSVRQFEVLNTIRYLRALDMPLPQIAAFLKNRDIPVMEAALRQQKAIVAEKARELRRIERKIENRLQQLSDAQRSRASCGHGWEHSATSFSPAATFSPHGVQSSVSSASVGGLGLLASTRLRSSIAPPLKMVSPQLSHSRPK